MTLSFSHFGICVRDLERSTAFYSALGFERAAAHEVGPEFSRLMDLDEVRVRSQFLVRDGVSIELLQFANPAPVAGPTPRPINQFGMTHLSFAVDDVASVEASLEAAGGSVLDATRTELSFGDSRLHFVYCTDPDGTRIELMDLGG